MQELIMTPPLSLSERQPDPIIQQQHRQLSSEALLVGVVNAMPGGVLMLNPQRQVILINRALLDTLGLAEPDQALGQRPGELLDCTHASDNPGGCGTADACQTCGALHAILEGLKARSSRHECRLLRSDGVALDLRISVTPSRIAGEPLLIFAVEDISAEKRREVMERVFFHDILNTASLLSIISEALEGNRTDFAEQAQAALSGVVHQLIEELQMQRDLLAAERQDLALHIEAGSANAVLSLLRASFSHHPLSHDKGLRIEETPPDFLLETDWTLLGRILTNLVKNALEASGPGDCVRVGCERRAGEMVFTVSNPAVIPHHAQMQLFKRSFSTRGPGRGIGLYSVRLLTEGYLCGRVSFQSAEGPGTVFRVTLPIRWPGKIDGVQRG